MKHFSSETQKLGEYGESLCCKWLNENHFKVLERNYTKREGEIDVIARKGEVLHFIEVKSVSYETQENFDTRLIYNPAQNVTRHKIRKCYTVIKHYLREKHVSYETPFQFDVYVIYIDRNGKDHKLKRIENVVFE